MPERLTKSERVGLIAFACATAVYLLTCVALRHCNGKEAELSEQEKQQIEQFRKQVESVQKDTIKPASSKKKRNGRSIPKERNPIDDVMPRNK